MKYALKTGLWGALLLAAGFACGAEESDGGDSCANAKCQSQGGAGGEGGSDGTEPEPNLCKSDAECDDGDFCNGEESCDPDEDGASSRGCVVMSAGPCPGQACDEANDACVACEEGDVDKDGHKAIACEGDDCDDNDNERYPGNEEVCDAAGHDEDCDLDTLGGPRDADKDEDTFVDAACCNQLANGDLSCGDDCDDALTGVNVGQIEACNGIDDNCDGIVDGASDAGDLEETFYHDGDGDGFGDESSVMRACMQPSTEWVDTGGDCADVTGSTEAQSIHPGADERCNGQDDDCDGQTDTDDTDSALVEMPVIAGTEFECTDGGWHITATGCPTNRLSCDENELNGCETDVTTLSNCGDCDNACFFSCGTTDCNEITQVSAGANHTCARTEAGTAYCWGFNGAGQLGDGTKNNRSTPTLVSGLSEVVTLDAGTSHTCAIVGASRKVRCWGAHDDYQLGTLAVTPSVGSTTPVEVDLVTNAVSVAASQRHACAVQADGAAFCWGARANGRTGTGVINTSHATSPARVRLSALTSLSGAVAVVAGNLHGCILRNDATVWCWGDNTDGQLGLGTTSDVPGLYAAQVPGLTGVTRLAAGELHTCALSGGKVYCWGDNSEHQLGRDTEVFSSPGEVQGLTGVTDLDAGFGSTCVVRSGGVLECWGRNEFGERGDVVGPVEDSTIARTTLPLTGATSVTCSANGHNCAVRSSGSAHCWGLNTFGQLGSARPDTHDPQLLSKP